MIDTLFDIGSFVCACLGVVVIMYHATSFIAWHLKKDKNADDFKMLGLNALGVFFGCVAVGTALVNLLG